MDHAISADGASSSSSSSSSSSPPPQNAEAVHGCDGEGAQAVKVAVHIRPLIGAELLQGCKDCVSIVYGEPQVQIGNHSFTFDHVYGNKASPSSSIFDECVSPLLEGLFQGYNATVLAYGQTGSGKTYTMGTGYTVGGSTEGVIPKVMAMIYKKVASLKLKAEFQIRVSFIEILKEEVHDLLDPNPPIAIKSDTNNGFGSKTGIAVKPPIQIRENTNGEITLAGVTDVDVASLDEMASCLERGSLCRATASTNMNSRSSRSHAIFTITLEQRRMPDVGIKGNYDVGDDFLCAKLHLVDLAGSERAKRTGADGVRFKEGVHINKGLLALGNVISALGDEKKRKEGGHVPYRDSKLTRLLQDSLGGNSRTVMIACISPADSNAEETLNTLKYANRARNIQNKPVVNRDPMAAEMRHMRQQVELLQAELLCIREGGSFEEIQILKQRIAWLEASLLQLQQDLKVAHENLHHGEQHLLETQVERDKLKIKLDMLQSGKTWEEACKGDSESTGLLESYAEQIKSLGNEIHQLRSSAPRSLISGQTQYQMATSVLDNDMSMLSLPEVPGIGTTEIEEETVAKEMEHAQLQDSLDKELEELNKRLEQKEAEMKSFAKCDGVVLKHHFEKKIVELEEEKKTLQTERDMLVAELTRLANTSDEHSQKLQETYSQKVKSLETQISELKKKQESQTHLLKQKQRSDEAAKRLQEEIQRIKSQKVHLQNKIKQESEQFRSWKASREKEVLQLKKEGRRNEFEMHKLQGLHQRQKMVLQRKTEECAAATRRLNELLESRKALSRENSGASTANGSGRQRNDKGMQQSIDDELEVAIRIHEVRSNYEKQSEARAALAKELAKLKQDQDAKADTAEIPGSASKLSMSPGARQAKIGLLESMLNASSSALVAMASQLSEAEERERAFSSRARWQHVRSMADAKSLLQYILNSAVEARCKVWDKEVECKEFKEKISELTILLKQSEAHRQERDRQEHAKEQHIAKMISSAAKIGTTAAMKSCLDEISKSLLQSDEICPRQLEYPEDFPEALENDKRNDPKKACEDSSNDHCSDNDDESDMDWCPSNSDTDEDSPPSKSNVGKMKAEKYQTGVPEQKSSHESDIKLAPDSHLCCSCGRYSGCKTNKCACRAAGSLCGANCGCVAKKCANRELGAESVDASEVAEAMETLTLDKEIRHAQTSMPRQSNDEIVSDSVLSKSDVQRAEQVLAKHGADMLGNAWADGSELVGSLSLKREQDLRTGVLPEKRHIRRPLSDIGNNTQNEEPRTKQRKRWTKAPAQTVTVQLIPTTKEDNVSTVAQQQPKTLIQNENEPQEITSGLPNVLKYTQDLSTEISSFEPTKIPGPPGKVWNPVSDLEGCELRQPSSLQALPSQFTVGLHLQGKMHRHNNPKKKLSPSGSPLRARNTTLTMEESSGINKKYGGTSGSPRAPGKGISQEKENV